MDWNFQRFKYMDDLVQNMLEEKAEVKKQNCKKGLRGGNFVGFGFLFEDGQPDSENSKLVKAPTVPKVTSRHQ